MIRVGVEGWLQELFKFTDQDGFGHGTHLLVDHLATLEEQDGGDTAYAKPGGCMGITVNIEFTDDRFAVIVLADFFNDGADKAAWTAPGGPKIEDDRFISFQDDLVKIRISYFQSHRSTIL